MDVGLLILRLVVGALFVGHGTQKLFGWFGGGGLQGTGQFYGSAGYRPGVPMAMLAGASEAGGGVLLVFGLLTPLGAAAIIGVMVNATFAVHWKNGLWNTNGGFELPLVMAASAAALAFTGPGRWSLDRAFGWRLFGVPWGLGAVLVGMATAGLVLGWRSAMMSREAGRGRHERHERTAA